MEKQKVELFLISLIFKCAFLRLFSKYFSTKSRQFFLFFKPVLEKSIFFNLKSVIGIKCHSILLEIEEEINSFTQFYLLMFSKYFHKIHRHCTVHTINLSKWKSQSTEIKWCIKSPSLHLKIIVGNRALTGNHYFKTIFLLNSTFFHLCFFFLKFLDFHSEKL